MPNFFKRSSKSTTTAPTAASADSFRQLHDEHIGDGAANACASHFDRHPKNIEPENRLIESSSSSLDSATNRTLPPPPSIDQWPNENAPIASVGERVSNFMNGFFSHIMAKGKNRRGHGKGSLKTPKQNQHNYHHSPAMPTIIEQQQPPLPSTSTVPVKKKQHFQPSKQMHQQLPMRPKEPNTTNCPLVACAAAGVVIGHPNRAGTPHATHEKNENDHKFMAKFKRNNQNKNSCKLYDGIMTTANETSHNGGSHKNQRDATKILNLNARSTYSCGGHNTGAACDVPPTDTYVIEHRKNNVDAVAAVAAANTAHLVRSNGEHFVVENSLNDELTPCYSDTRTGTTPLPRTLNAFHKSHDPNSTSPLSDRNTDCSEEDSIRFHSTEIHVDPAHDRHDRPILIDYPAVDAAAPLLATSSSLGTTVIASTSPHPHGDSGHTELPNNCRQRGTNFECNSERSSLNLPLILIEFVSTLNSSSLAHGEPPSFPPSQLPSGNGSDMGNTQPKSKSQNATNADSYDPRKSRVNNEAAAVAASPTLNENKDIFYEASSELSVEDDRSPTSRIDDRPTTSDSCWAEANSGVVDAKNHDYINKIANNTCESTSSCVGRDGGASSDDAATATPIMLNSQATYSCDGRSERDDGDLAATNSENSMEKNRVYRLYESAGDGDIDFSGLEEISCTSALVTEVQDDDDDGLRRNRARRNSANDDPIANWHRRHGQQDAVQIVEVNDGDFGSDESIDDGGKVEEIPDIHVIKVIVEGVEVLDSEHSENDENIETIEEIEEIIEVEVSDDEEIDEIDEVDEEDEEDGGSSASTASTHENENQSAFTKFINQPTNGNTISYSSKYNNHLNNNDSVNSHRSNRNNSNNKNDVENVILFNDEPHKFSNNSNGATNGTATVSAVAPPSPYMTTPHNNHNPNSNNNNLPNNQSSFNGGDGGGATKKKKCVRFSHSISEDSDNFPNKIMKMSSLHRNEDKYASGKYGGDEPMQLPDIVVESVESTATAYHIANGIDDSEQSASTEASQSTGDDDESCSADGTDADDTSQGEEDEVDRSISDSVQDESEPSDNET